MDESMGLESALQKEAAEKEDIVNLESLPISPCKPEKLDIKWISELAREAAKKAISQHFLYFSNPKYFNNNLQEVESTGKNDKQCKICIRDKTLRQRFKYPPDSMQDAIEFGVISILKQGNDARIAKEVADESAQHTVHSWFEFDLKPSVSRVRINNRIKSNNVRESKE